MSAAFVYVFSPQTLYWLCYLSGTAAFVQPRGPAGSTLYPIYGYRLPFSVAAEANVGVRIPNAFSSGYPASMSNVGAVTNTNNVTLALRRSI